MDRASSKSEVQKYGVQNLDQSQTTSTNAAGFTEVPLSTFPYSSWSSCPELFYQTFDRLQQLSLYPYETLFLLSYTFDA